MLLPSANTGTATWIWWVWELVEFRLTLPRLAGGEGGVELWLSLVQIRRSFIDKRDFRPGLALRNASVYRPFDSSSFCLSNLACIIILESLDPIVAAADFFPLGIIQIGDGTFWFCATTALTSQDRIRRPDFYPLNVFIELLLHGRRDFQKPPTPASLSECPPRLTRSLTTAWLSPSRLSPLY